MEWSHIYERYKFTASCGLLIILLISLVWASHSTICPPRTDTILRLHDRFISTHFTNDYTVLRIYDPALIIMIENRSKHTVHVLQAKDIGAFVNFISDCIVCTENHYCHIANNSLISVKAPNSTTELIIEKFSPCEIPTDCYWFQTKFDCSTLTHIYRILTD